MTPFKSFLFNRVFTGMTLIQLVPPTRRPNLKGVIDHG